MGIDEGLPKDLTAEEFTRFRDHINSHAGIYMEEGKRDALRIALVARATLHGLVSYDDYLGLLQSSEDEFKELLNIITINETSFFRFPGQFDALRDHVLPEILGEKTGGAASLRVWSAGCSTGEEPYSLAMALADTGIETLGWRPQVLGTDVSTAALQVARAGVYPARSLLNVPEDVVARHFEEVGDGRFRIREATRRVTDFAYHNLIKEPYPLSLMGEWDIIFCRNVTIYFKLESTKRVVANFFRMLNPGGYLFIGHSETLSNLSPEFEAVEIGGVFLYRKPRKKLLSVPPIHPLRAGETSRRTAATDGTGARRRISEPDTAGERGTEGRTGLSSPARRTAGRAESVRGSSRSAAEPAAPAADVVAGDVAGLLAKAKRLASSGEPSEVLGIVDAIRVQDPQNPEASIVAAYAYADLGRYDEALSACQEALNADPLLPEARYILGIIHQRRDDPIRAMSEFKKTIYIDAGFALAHLNLGNLYKAQRKWDLAHRSYENALRALYADPEGAWSGFMGGFKADLLVKTIERSLAECRKAAAES